MDKHSYLGSADAAYIESLYSEYRNDPSNVDESWRKFFEGFEFAGQKGTPPLPCDDAFEKEFRVISLIEGYRLRGHLFTKTNPVRTRRQYTPTLDIENFGLSAEDLGTVFKAGSRIGIGPATLQDIVDHLEQTYCQSVGAEYMFIRVPEIISWLTGKMESVRNTPDFSAGEKKDIYHHLMHAVGFEQFIHRKFVGQKRFSLEGNETLIPALDAVIEKGAGMGIEEYVIGMAHRGRLNVLATIMRKPYQDIFDEFNGKQYNDEIALGDVKYHLGYNSTIKTDHGKKVRLNLVPNPSHLEAVDPVTLGIARAKIDHNYGGDFSKLAPILIHGDSAIAGQGVVYEVIQMSQLNGYKTGGTIHLVLNNQVGFTTNYLDARSSTYCTDVAKVTKSPVFHVNGDDVEALIYTITLAMEYRQKYHSDVFIDILGYRRFGHNEGDEPRFTQPLLYNKISKHPNARDIYGKKLVEQGVYTTDDIKQAEKNLNNILEEKLKKSKEGSLVRIAQFMKEDWGNFRYSRNEDFSVSPETGFDRKKLVEIAEKINTLPEGKSFFSKIKKLLEDRRRMVSDNRLDWAMAELLAYGSLLLEGHPVRVSGQDSERGTFSHRHAAYVLEDSDEKYFPLKHLSPDQAKFHIYNSLLSEYGVMGFEYGYSLAVPRGLTIWEAQFGDFHNVAQVIIDQYISSAEEKWGLMNGLTLFLPHGYEGQGPEHSSARIERFLALCANDNMQIVNCTTPANLFHLLRRQMHRPFRIPLIVFTPKSLLRHPACISGIEELASGSFREVIDDDLAVAEDVRQVVFTSGRLYYDLVKRREELGASDTAIVRIEQLYPLPLGQIRKIIKKYGKAERYVWAQDEPVNMGAWSYLQRVFREVNLLLISRPASGSPASGLLELHKKRLEKILDKTFQQCNCELRRKYCGQRCGRFAIRELNKEMAK
ncbi:MAG: 2-oxoglutarate dehydrogenase E1 component [Marinilabiliales bacterium]|nr:MAG: 2-oxoglutarate dehydrogenase E1 component [Marinilabiliales bacterium]